MQITCGNMRAELLGNTEKHIVSAQWQCRWKKPTDRIQVFFFFFIVLGTYSYDFDSWGCSAVLKMSPKASALSKLLLLSSDWWVQGTGA